MIRWIVDGDERWEFDTADEAIAFKRATDTVIIHTTPPIEIDARDFISDASGRLIAPPQTAIAERPQGPHAANHDARKPVQS